MSRCSLALSSTDQHSRPDITPPDTPAAAPTLDGMAVSHKVNPVCILGLRLVHLQLSGSHFVYSGFTSKSSAAAGSQVGECATSGQKLHTD